MLYIHGYQDRYEICSGITIAGYPQAPIVNFYNASNMFCFTIPDNPIHPEVYEVNLTDSTGSQTRLSGVYNTSQCLTITSDLHPNVCGPFQLSVAVMNTVGREETTPTIIPDSTTAEPTPCDCYQQKGKLAPYYGQEYTRECLTSRITICKVT